MQIWLIDRLHCSARRSLTRHLNEFLIFGSAAWGIPTHLRWKSDLHSQHSSSGKPLTPGQYGVQGAKTLFEGLETLKKKIWKTIRFEIKFHKNMFKRVSYFTLARIQLIDKTKTHVTRQRLTKIKFKIVNQHYQQWRDIYKVKQTNETLTFLPMTRRFHQVRFCEPWRPAPRPGWSKPKLPAGADLTANQKNSCDP